MRGGEACPVSPEPAGKDSMAGSSEIRRQFIEFFSQRGHVFVPSSPVVPHDDPTLMFTNAGMNQFKDVFLGTGSRPYRRAANSQKCIRAGGKHNDLDDVGKDTYHHTFFEMLGNWSFGDYFKKDAIAWAWELLTKVWGIDKKRLHATYFRGDPAEGLEPDTEAAELWRTVTDIDPSHIHPGNKKDNFWEMGDTGPCGPCSEVHIDLTPDKSGGKLVNAGDARVMEIWNLVFIQYNRGADGKLTPLPARHVDTGMGFERICSVIQGMRGGRLGSFSNYDTDVFTPIFAAIRQRTGAPEYRGTLPDQSRDRKGADVNQTMVDVSYRVIADHLRCLTFAMTDGAMPSNEGRGYVLRRILRRAVRYGRQYLNMSEPFLCDLVQPLVDHMGDAFPELRSAHGGKNIRNVADVLREEEASFGKTLDRGIKLFNEAADYAITHHHGRISGEAAFKLHDTYGFPIDLTEQMAEERGLTVDIGEYERLMEEARRTARVSVDMADADEEERQRDALEDARTKIQVVDTAKYDADLRCKTFISGGSWNVRTGDDSAYEGQSVIINLAQTPFYAEQGGQVSDVGEIVTKNGTVEITHVKKLTHSVGFAILHIGKVIKGRIVGDEECEAIVSKKHRIPTMQNHTATHILNWALREVLCSPEERTNPHVQQKGSLVDPEKTRFDFSHPKALTDDELARIETLCNQQIAAGLTVYAATREEDFVDQAAARRINTLRAVFGEKYPEKVRVVSIGVPIEDLLREPSNPKWMQYSVEFCGGTHVKNTREIEAFVLTHEEAVAKGIRRVVGVSGDAAKRAEALGSELLDEVAALDPSRDRLPFTSRSDVQGEGAETSTRLADVQRRLADAVIPIRVRHRIREKLATLQEVLKKLQKQQAAVSGEAAMDRVAALLAEAQTVDGVTVVVGEVPSAPVEALRSAIDWIRNKTPASAVLLATVTDGKVTLMAGMSKVAVERGLKAGDLIKDISPLVGGKGGGRPDMAQGGGTEASGLANALDRAMIWLRQRL
jgi:alanyl-tRNA synthetase